jgi:hypothetical protein
MRKLKEWIDPIGIVVLTVLFSWGMIHMIHLSEAHAAYHHAH